MKAILLAITLFFASTASAQVAQVGDTLKYNNKNYAVGDTVMMLYGSKADKSFAFIVHGGGMMGMDPMNASYSKQQVILDKVFKKANKYFLRGKLTENNIVGFKIFIDLEGAVDNKELRE